MLAIPLSQEGAERVLRQEAARAPSKIATSSSSSDEEDEDEEEDVQTPSIVRRESFMMTNARSEASIDPRATATVRPKDAKKWFARGGARSASEAQVGMGEQGTVGPDAPVAQPDAIHAAAGQGVEQPSTQDAAAAPSAEAFQDANKAELEDKLVREATRQFARGEMFFSYDFDLTTPLQRKNDQAVKANGGNTNGKVPSADVTAPPFEEPRPTLPLWRRADRRFFHNEHMVQDFISAGAHSLVLPLMQGYFQTTSLPLSEPDLTAQLLIISRRSRERPGLRYQRRGVNGEGQVANYVETEQVLLVRRAGQEGGDGAQSHLFSFVQFRGSIPLYWSQSPFSLKPPPVLERSAAENNKAFARHFAAQVERYDKVTCVNLAEQSGKEGEITAAYQKGVETLADDRVRYLAFDFHHECAGMHFENVSRLVDRLQETLDEMGFFWRSSSAPQPAATSPPSKAAAKPSPKDSPSSPGVLAKQFGTFRVSCLDCLDRTGVVASAFGRHMLLKQLASIGIAQVKDDAFDFAFNDMWANNGDQISQCYAGSRALKGDFTRTGRRNWTGVFNDATASVYRLVQGAVTDFWRQTVISFVYGELSLSGLEKYGDELQSADPSNEVRLARVRAAAIETCASMVLGNEEVRVGGWTLWAPHEANRVQSSRLEEKIVLLTSKNLYVCAYDFTADKLSEYSRIKLGDVTGLQRGEYILSPREGYNADQHWGLVIYYLEESKRVNVASIKNVPPPEVAAATAGKSGGGKSNFICLKAVADEFSGTLERERDPPLDKGDGSSLLRGGKVRFAQGDTASSKFSSTDSTLRSSRVIRSAPEDQIGSGLTSKAIVEAIVKMLVEECAAAGACELDADGEQETAAEGDEAFVKVKAVQTLDQAKAQAPLFGGLIEGLKRRVWL